MSRNMSTTPVSRMEGGNAAFTLIELMIVIVIIGIAAAMAIPMVSSAASFQIRSAANLVAADLEYAKSMAISRGRPYKVVFDSSTESYQVEDPNNNVVTPPGRRAGATFGAGTRLSQVVINTASFGGSQTVTFDYLGSPDNGGTVELQAEGITKRINVEPVTGFISISN